MIAQLLHVNSTHFKYVQYFGRSKLTINECISCMSVLHLHLLPTVFCTTLLVCIACAYYRGSNLHSGRLHGHNNRLQASSKLQQWITTDSNEDDIGRNPVADEVHGWSEKSYDMFLQKYLQRQPLLIRNALPAIETLINLNTHDYYELMQDDDVESRLFLRKDGKTEKLYGPFTADYLQALPARDWSILLQEVDRHIPKVSDLWDIGFNFIPSWRRDDIMISYSMPGGGIGGHVDNYDVFLLQGR